MSLPRSIVGFGIRRAMSTAAGSSAPTGSAPPSAAVPPTESPEPTPAKPTNLVMQIILRRDLVTELGWPLGPMMAQAAHAATAVQHRFAAHPEMQRYLAGEDGRAWEVMRKAVLEVPDEPALRALSARLDAADIPHHLWIEEPEHTPTAIALMPNKRPKGIKKILDDAGCTLWR